ncbi:hypothetical protein RRG08_022654 [Elysia crispata]|uniref:Uncharacterized protein n=1 Tax=Elysia crispata TaxID=231223 RepID=A0AAE0Z1K5_9GAST|nr:hypothetical protein RRG08_022654 [Elysia crispata]
MVWRFVNTDIMESISIQKLLSTGNTDIMESISIQKLLSTGNTAIMESISIQKLLGTGNTAIMESISIQKLLGAGNTAIMESISIQKLLSTGNTDIMESISIQKLLSTGNTDIMESISIQKLLSTGNTDIMESISIQKLLCTGNTAIMESISIQKLLSTGNTAIMESISIQKLLSTGNTAIMESISIQKLLSTGNTAIMESISIQKLLSTGNTAIMESISKQKLLSTGNTAIMESISIQKLLGTGNTAIMESISIQKLPGFCCEIRISRGSRAAQRLSFYVKTSSRAGGSRDVYPLTQQRPQTFTDRESLARSQVPQGPAHAPSHTATGGGEGESYHRYFYHRFLITTHAPLETGGGGGGGGYPARAEHSATDRFEPPLHDPLCTHSRNAGSVAVTLINGEVRVSVLYLLFLLLKHYLSLDVSCHANVSLGEARRLCARVEGGAHNGIHLALVSPALTSTLAAPGSDLSVYSWSHPLSAVNLNHVTRSDFEYDSSFTHRAGPACEETGKWRPQPLAISSCCHEMGEQNVQLSLPLARPCLLHDTFIGGEPHENYSIVHIFANHR